MNSSMKIKAIVDTNIFLSGALFGGIPGRILALWKKAVFIFAVVTFILCQPAIFFLHRGVVDELDFWGGTFCLVLFSNLS